MIKFTLYKSFENDYKEIRNNEKSKKKLEHQSQFIDLWDKYTQNLFEGLDWMGYIVAGEFICKCISNTVTDETEINLYIYGENTEERAEIILKLLSNFEERDAEFSVNNSIIKICGLERIIKIHCTNKKSPSEIVGDFDLSHLQIYYDGDDFKSTEQAFWSINKLKTIIINDTTIKAINNACSIGFDVLYKEGQKFNDDYGIKHNISLYKDILEIGTIDKNKNSGKITKSKAVALNYVVLDGDCSDHNIAEPNLHWKLLNLNYLRFEKSKKNQKSYVAMYNNKKLILRTPLMKMDMIKKIKLVQRTRKFALIDYFDGKFNELLQNIIQMQHESTTYYPHPDFDPIKNFKISKKIKTAWPNYFYALISIKCYNDNSIHKGKYWIITIKDIFGAKTINQSWGDCSSTCEYMEWQKSDKRNKRQQRSPDDDKNKKIKTEINDMAIDLEEFCHIGKEQ